jgi:hypothetical protein
MKKSTIFVLCIVALISAILIGIGISDVTSSDNNRYAAVVVPRESGYREDRHRDDQLYILDTRTGYLSLKKA